MTKNIKHYNCRIPSIVKQKYRREFNIRLRLFAAYADLYEELFRIGYYIELVPFYTFSYVDRTAFVCKIWALDNENTRWTCIFDEEKEWNCGDGFGSSFRYIMDNVVYCKIMSHKYHKLYNE